jgi:hypothetical protein
LALVVNGLLLAACGSETPGMLLPPQQTTAGTIAPPPVVAGTTATAGTGTAGAAGRATTGTAGATPGTAGKPAAGGAGAPAVTGGMGGTTVTAGTAAVTAGTGGMAGATGMAGASGTGTPPTGGMGESACLDGITTYDAAGPFMYENKNMGSVKMWVPKVPAGCKVPLVHLNNGTGASCANYQNVLNRFASHGFITLCYENANTGAGAYGVTAIDTAMKAFPDLYSKKIGSTGHSQGGQAAFTTLALAEAKWGEEFTYAGLAMEPASGFGGHARASGVGATGLRRADRHHRGLPLVGSRCDAHPDAAAGDDAYRRRVVALEAARRREGV